MEISEYDLIEHIDKNTGSNGYSHDKIYMYFEKEFKIYETKV